MKKSKTLNVEVLISKYKLDRAEIESALKSEILDAYGIDVQIDPSKIQAHLPDRNSNVMWVRVSYQFEGIPVQGSKGSVAENVCDRLCNGDWVENGHSRPWTQKDTDNLVFEYSKIYKKLLTDRASQDRHNEWEFVKYFFITRFRKMFYLFEYPDFHEYLNVKQRLEKIKDVDAKLWKYITRGLRLRKSPYNLKNFNFYHCEYTKKSLPSLA